MREWYFTPITWIQQGQRKKCWPLPRSMEWRISYRKYLNTLRVGAERNLTSCLTKATALHCGGPGIFRDYYYTREAAFPSCWRRSRNMPGISRRGTGGTNRLSQSGRKSDRKYCSGVYLSPKQVVQLLRDLEQMPKVLEDLEGLWRDGQFAVLKRPHHCRRNWVSAC